VGFEELALLSLSSFMVGLSGAVMPGTVFIFVILQSAEKGWKVGPLVVLGHVILETALGIALVLGLSTVMTMQIVRTTIGFVGGVVLLWMSFGLLKASRRAELPTGASDDRATQIHSSSVLAGLVASSVNPYFYVWWATIGNVFTIRGFELAGLVGVATFLVSHWMSDLSWYSLVSWSVGRSRKYLTNPVYRLILGICGIFLLALGLLFLYGAATGTI